MDDCIFCRILAGRAEATIVWRDERCTAFMDIQPVNPGHVLIVPNVHAAQLPELGEDDAAHLMRIGQRLVAALRASGLRCEGVNLFLADGAAAMQEIFHVHLHVIPRFAGDGFGLRFGPHYRERPGRAALDEAAARIRPALAPAPAPPPDAAATFPRHTLATLVYRGAKAVRGAPPAFATFRVGPESRTPAQILAHIGDVLEWGAWMVRGEHRWRDSEPLPWGEEVERFFRTAGELDAALASARPAPGTLERVFQGPIADVLTHIGQLAMLRRLAGAPVRGENYARAEILVGRTGAEQAAPRVEFD